MEIAQSPPSPSHSGEILNSGSSANGVEAMAPSSSLPPKRLEHETTLPSRPEDELEEDEVCRICGNSGSSERPLQYPCACTGSIKFVHLDCQLQWLNHSNRSRCEVCKHSFSFSPVYAENTPARIPFQEIVVGMAMKAYHVQQRYLHVSLVLSIWVLVIPFITSWIWRLDFVRSFDEAKRLFLSPISTSGFLIDCLHGVLICAGIVFIFLGVAFLKDFIGHLQEMEGQDADREDEGIRNGTLAARQPPLQGNINLAGDGNAGRVEGIPGPDQMIRRNAENVDAQREMQAAHLENHVEQMFHVLEAADDAENEPFVELVAMHGSVFRLAETAVTVLASKMIFLAVVVFVPFSLGRFALYCISWPFFSATIPVLTSVKLLTDSALSLANITLENALISVTNFSSENQEDQMIKVNLSGGLTEVAKNMNAPCSADALEGASIGSSRLFDITTLAVGYMFVFTLVFLYLGVVALIRYTIGRFYGIGSIAGPIPSLFRQFLAVMRHLVTIIKVPFLLVIEFGVFPLMCGCWLDICTIRMFGKSISQRVEFFSASPFTSLLVHWVVGIVYMLLMNTFVSLLRGVLREGVLCFLQDPSDPNYNPFHDLIGVPVHEHARSVLLSVAVYGSLIVMLVFLPVRLAMWMAPSIFPLDISLSDPFTEIPVDMLLFQTCIPFTIEHFKLRRTIESLLCYWFIAVGWKLDLTEYLLPRAGAQENRNQDVARQDRWDGVQVAGQNWQAVGFPDGATGTIHISENSNAAEEYDADEQSDSQYNFVLRIVLLLVAAWMTLLIFSSALMVVPISLGQTLFNAIPVLPITHGTECNDVYAFIVGSYVIWSALASARYCIEHIKTGQSAVLMSQIWKWCCIVSKSFIPLSIWIFVIPALIGLLFELLVIVPMWVPINESPVFLLNRDWAMGLVFLKIWTRLVMLDLPSGSWRARFQRVRNDGFSDVQALWVMREIIVPVMTNLLAALCVPYVLAGVVFPMLGCPPVVNSAVYRFAWLGCFFAWTLRIWFCNLRDAMRDERYLVGRRLQNYNVERVDEIRSRIN